MISASWPCSVPRPRWQLPSLGHLGLILPKTCLTLLSTSPSAPASCQGAREKKGKCVRETVLGVAPSLLHPLWFPPRGCRTPAPPQGCSGGTSPHLSPSHSALHGASLPKTSPVSRGAKASLTQQPQDPVPAVLGKPRHSLNPPLHGPEHPPDI